MKGWRFESRLRHSLYFNFGFFSKWRLRKISKSHRKKSVTWHAWTHFDDVLTRVDVQDGGEIPALSRIRKKRVPWWVGGNLGGQGSCWVCARSSHRRHRAGLGLLGIFIFLAGFSVPEYPRSSVWTSGPKLTVTEISSGPWSIVRRAPQNSTIPPSSASFSKTSQLWMVGGRIRSFLHLRLMYSVTSLSLAPIFKLPT